MEVTILKQETVNLKYVQCKLGVYNWKKCILNGKEDNNENPKTPFIKDKIFWCPLIDVEEGKIVDWPQGTRLEIFAKTLDDNHIEFLDENKNIIVWFDETEQDVFSSYEGYVPEFLDTIGDGYGDYVQLVVYEDGTILNFNKEEIINIFEKN